MVTILNFEYGCDKQGCIFCRYSPPPGGGNFFKTPEKTLPQGYFSFFTIVKFGEVFQEGGGEFFQDFGRIYTPARDLSNNIRTCSVLNV